VPSQTDFKYLCVQPADVPAEQIKECHSLIVKGRAVDPNTARAELPLAKWIAVALEPDSQKVIGVGVIKRCRPKYASRIAKSSGFSLNHDIHELGYVSVDESKRRRGISHQITGLLLTHFRERPLFATTSDYGMKRTLSAAGFTQEGSEWAGKYGRLSLWIKTSP
jgi:hypothetical protein